MTQRQIMFIEEYFRTSPLGNATRAAIAAGYSPKTARKQGSRLQTSVDIQEALRARGDQILKEVKADALQTVLKLLQCVHFDIRKLFDQNGQLITDITLLDDATASAIQSIEVVKKRRTGEWDEDGQPIYDDLYKIKMADKLKAIELLGRFQGIFKDTLQIPGLENVGSIRLPMMVEEGAPVPDFDVHKQQETE